MGRGGGAGSSVLGVLGRRWFGFGDGVFRWRGIFGTACMVAEARAAGGRGLFVDGRSLCAGGEGKVFSNGQGGRCPPLGVLRLGLLCGDWLRPLARRPEKGECPLTRSEEGLLGSCWALATGPSLGCRCGSGLACWMGWRYIKVLNT